MSSNPPPDAPSVETNDVVILGAGIAGSVLAAVLARGGANVLMIDAGTHPRFAVGESTIPYTSIMARLMAERYDVPELKALGTFESVQSKIGPTSGIKRNFGFLYHRRGEHQNTAEYNENVTPKIANTDSHLFRQDVDAWLVTVAVKYGARIRQQVRVTDVDFDDYGATVTGANGETWRTRYVVDASGFRSPLAQKFGLREEPSRLRHHSRSMFTHMVGVTPYDDLVPRKAHGNYRRWHQGTLHHVFEGGWLWVIPFNNHPMATNPLVSVGLTVDPRVHPDPGCGPEEEFRRFVADFPSIAGQFTNARPVREWVSTGRLQYSSRQTIGDRWCLMSHAAGFIDPLFSRGLSNTFDVINALAWRLLDALRDDDFSVERFALVEKLEQGLLDFNDDLVANSFTAFSDYDLWNAWFRLWSMHQRLAIFVIGRAYGKYRLAGDVSALDDLERLGVQAAMPDHPPTQELYARASQEIRAVAAGTTRPADAAARIMALLDDADFLPRAMGLHDPHHRTIHASGPTVARVLRWSRRSPSSEVADLFYDGITQVIRLRLARGEFAFGAELKHAVAGLPVLGRPFRADTGW
ncbi:NAD(P)/FAD-dependent oxidoreductase [Frankia sp. AgB32]|uniref:NAD(P)/FAD-dependent oxidoreductase n=1 Tax=Frankia sp. AgB32 TaxID=631119 RepID=UPI00200C1034|nr:tryptophan 7-halogenase [Frankia sp. AgB32]MCK9897084.1 tryptophan 7-halogenase [Frankia sp. AgB32]